MSSLNRGRRRTVALVAGFLAGLAALELAWLSSPVAKRMYAASFAALQAGPLRVRWGAAALCYVLLVAAALYLVVVPAAGAPSFLAAALPRATALALGSYGVYNLTNLATLRAYKPSVAAADTLWGLVLLNGSVAAAAASAAIFA